MGKRLLFLTTWDFSDGPSTGITKKIKSQIKVFLKQGYEVDYTYISDNYVWIYEKGIRHKIGKTKIGRKKEILELVSKFTRIFYFFQ